MKKILLGFLLVSTFVFADKIYEVKTSGVFIKDTLEIHSFVDEDTRGAVVCYYTLPKRSLSIEDQTDTSISCRQVAKIEHGKHTQTNISSSSKSWFYKNMNIDRVYDEKRNVLIYLTYTKKLGGDNASNSISIVPILNKNF